MGSEHVSGDETRLVRMLVLLAAIREPYQRGQISEGCIQIRLEDVRALNRLVGELREKVRVLKATRGTDA